MQNTLLGAALRLSKTLESRGYTVASDYTLQNEQVGVFIDAAEYIISKATDSEVCAPPFARIILPPRTGKTVVAAHLIAELRVNTTFFAPTKALIEQTERVLRKIMPSDIPIGVYYGDKKSLVAGGVNITTYQICQLQFEKDGLLPPLIASSQLVFADEGHRSMTRSRNIMLQGGFSKSTIRIALTATPDFNEERVLVNYFPDLIHEITVVEAVSLDLLAPLRFWVAEVDTDASHVHLVDGELDQTELGRIMSHAPFLEAANTYRYSEDNLSTPAVIFCASVTQAKAVHSYLSLRRPNESKEPQLVLGTTPTSHRKAILDGFLDGTYDTLISVNMLVEGWDAPNCKLAIDLSPSISFVRAKQKYFRVMTKWQDQQARIFVIIPKNLRRQPIMPIDLFHGSRTQAYCTGDIVGRRVVDTNTLACPSSVVAVRHIKGVQLLSRILMSVQFEKPGLDPSDTIGLRKVLLSQSQFLAHGKHTGLQEFRWMHFNHHLFTGRGEQFLRYLGFSCSRDGYILFMAKVFPDIASELWLTYEYIERQKSIREIVVRDEESLLRNALIGIFPPQIRRIPPARSIQESWLAGCGPTNIIDEDNTNVEEIAIRRQTVQIIIEHLDQWLSERDVAIFCYRHGIRDGVERNLSEIAKIYRCSVESIRCRLQRMYREIRYRMAYKIGVRKLTKK